MGNIKGIRVDIATASSWWSPTADAFFLGVYGSAGGREFRLNGGIAINQPMETLYLTLGDACCKTPHDIQVQYSVNLGDNDPLLNPIDIDSVQFVYLRKETANSTSTNDDVLVLQWGTVLLCDSDGRLRRFRKTGKINFSDEAGLQHWLGEIAPPQCRITVTLVRIEHNDEAKHPAGKKWRFYFGAGETLSYNNIINGLYHHATSPDEWQIDVGSAVSFSIYGCCGSDRAIYIYGKATEHDLFIDDQTEEWRTETVKCTKEPSTKDEELSFIVFGQLASHKSKIKFVYQVTSVCID